MITATVQHPQIGVCGLSCRLCPRYQTEAKSKCNGCKTASRMGAGCAFVTCALKRKGVEFCWQCDESAGCEKWRKHRDLGKQYDSFVCYQALEDNIAFVREHGIAAFEQTQLSRESLLKRMLAGFNDGRAKTKFCIAATLLPIDDLAAALQQAENSSAGLEIKAKSKLLHSLLDKLAEGRGVVLKLRSGRKL